ncbi:hypothetical protein M1M25_gp093 [Tenacibaculum phage Gundel_1]|uniref:Uncharacterized protein n=1 Tax=Tenacibaculum phage Gundel_1 TaxID=2745672 RepID=A0A8E4ZL54_9CAUD|nr:hypothetical protein M1M25_gp093 [Tenacibaculum phage Gundel_1]QQV91531.1 hypothetical protein Gundel1_93 [Tenacibaculum phage Gundel_1]
MPVFKKTIRLIAESVDFTFNSIVYKVRLDCDENVYGAVSCVNDIKYKDLVLKPTIIDRDNLEVIFSTDLLTPSFYQSILKGTIRNLAEYENEKSKIYLPGDVVGVIVGYVLE